MKKIALIFIVVILFSSISNAQGVYQLWGMTSQGGTSNSGVIYSTDSAGNNYRVRYDFKVDANPGFHPASCEPVEYNGKVYGIIRYGGLNNEESLGGVIFEWDPITNIYTKKIDLVAATGYNSNGGLTLYGNKFYGITQNGGANNRGVLFEWDPVTNVYTVKFNFTITDGASPHGTMIVVNNKLYGTTRKGGANDYGVIFEWDLTTNVYTKKADFNSDLVGFGSFYEGTLAFGGGKFYGMTTFGGVTQHGVLFEWDPSGSTIAKKIELTSATGRDPNGGLTFYSGKLYGGTLSGGANGIGVLFEWDPITNIYLKKYDFTFTDGADTRGILKFFGSKFYGMLNGGGTNQSGVIFEWDISTNVFTKKIEFNFPDGKWPLGSLCLSGSKFYGLTGYGGSDGAGVIFEWDPATNIYTKKIDLNISASGYFPTGSLTLSNGNLYGMTKGTVNAGSSIFQYNPSAGSYKRKINNSITNGNSPNGNSLTQYNNKFYGLNQYGGATNQGGVIFEWDSASNIYTQKIDLNNVGCPRPQGNLTMYNNKFYGTSAVGGFYNLGTIFEWDPNSNVFIKKNEFSPTTASFPVGSLALYTGKFYGMTNGGGANSAGVIFEWNPATNIFTKKIDFDFVNGGIANGSLILSNGKFYGMTSFGGTNNAGVIFEWNPSTNIYIKKIDLDSTTGRYPLGSLLLSGNRFYGTTNGGGANNAGVIFEWDAATNIYTKTKDFNSTDGVNNSLGADLIRVPASIVAGLAGGCVNMPIVTINNGNNNMWVPILDNLGNVLAEIKANGNNLGTLNASVFINNTTIREDNSNHLYLDRNLTITPQVQPATPVDMRLYLTQAEFTRLKNSINSLGQPSGINTITDIAVFKNNDACLSAIQNAAVPVTTASASWGADYVVTASINSFSSFYFANNTYAVLPLTIISFNGKQANDKNVLYWTVENDINNKYFDIERSTDGRTYIAIGSVASVQGIGSYSFTDVSSNVLNATVVYYRFKAADINGSFSYSGIIAMSNTNKIIVLTYPNPATSKLNVSIGTVKADKVKISILDITGRLIKIQETTLVPGSTAFDIDITVLSKGIYFLDISVNSINERKQFSKQ